MEKSLDIAEEWYIKATDENADGLLYSLGFFNNLGDRYFNGDGVKQPYEKASICYQKGASVYRYHDMYMLGICYELGLGVEQSYAKAWDWYQKSYGQGDYYKAKIALAALNFFGCGREHNVEAAVEAIRELAEKGFDEVWVFLAYFYLKGYGGLQSDEKARKWYDEAAHYMYKEAMQ